MNRTPPAPTHGENGHGNGLDGLASVVTVDRADDIASVCGRLDTAPTFAVVVHAPGGNRSLSTELGMRRLQRHAEEGGKMVAIATPSLGLANRARQVGIPVARKPDQVRWDSAGHRVVRLGRWSAVTPALGGYAQAIAVLGVLIVFAFLALTMAPSADVVVVPPADTVSEIVTVTASPRLDSPDFAALKVPASRVSTTQHLTLTQKATGKVQVPTQAALAVVAITNPGPADVQLPQGAVLLAGGQQFVLALDTAVPAGKTVTQGATAAIAGATGNVPPGTLTGFQEAKFANLKVVQAAAATGGASEERLGVGQDDVLALRTAATDLQKSGTLRQAILTARPHDAVFLDTADAKVDLGEPRPAVGEPGDIVLMDVDVTISALAIPADTLEQLALHVLGSKQGKGEFVPGSVTAAAMGNSKTNADDGSVTTQLRLSGLYTRNVTSSDIENAVKGKSTGDAKSTLKERYGIENADVSVSPGWAPWLPRFGFRVNVEMKAPVDTPGAKTAAPVSDSAPAPTSSPPASRP